MRGGPFSNPAVVELLRPFIITFWYGHRDSDMPDVVWNELSKRSRNAHRESNVFYLIIGSDGHLVHTFDAFPKGSRTRSNQDYVSQELQFALDKIGSDLEIPPRTPMRLPRIPWGKTSPGIRVYVQLRDQRMRAYQAPVVEVLRFGKIARTALEYPETRRQIPAETLGAMLSQIYPPGIMERTDPDTKHVYDIDVIDGTLTLEPIQSSGKMRYAILKGNIRLHDSGRDDFSYSGSVECLVGYDREAPSFKFMRGTFDGMYPRQGRNGGIRDIRLVAAFETTTE